MSTQPHTHDTDGIEMPEPTAAPLVFALGIALLGLGLATSLIFVAVGGVLFGMYQHAVSGDLSNALNTSEQNRKTAQRANNYCPHKHTNHDGRQRG